MKDGGQTIRLARLKIMARRFRCRKTSKTRYFVSWCMIVVSFIVVTPHNNREIENGIGIEQSSSIAQVDNHRKRREAGRHPRSKRCDAMRCDAMRCDAMRCD
jgi:hypothetical protein